MTFSSSAGRRRSVSRSPLTRMYVILRGKKHAGASTISYSERRDNLIQIIRFDRERIIRP